MTVSLKGSGAGSPLGLVGRWSTVISRKIVVGMALYLLLGGSLMIWSTQWDNSTRIIAVPSAIKSQVESAIAQSLQIIPAGAVSLNQGLVLPRLRGARLLLLERRTLRHLFSPTSSELESSLTAYKNALATMGRGRNLSVSFQSFNFTGFTYGRGGPTVKVSFAAHTETVEARREGQHFGGAWKKVDIPGQWTGQAVFVAGNGAWLIQTISLTDSDAG